MIPEDETENFQILRECLEARVVHLLAPEAGGKGTRRRTRGRKNELKPVTPPVDVEADATDLSEFVEYLAEEVFTSLPVDLRRLSYAVLRSDDVVAGKYSTPLDSTLLGKLVTPLPLTVADSLMSYGLLAEASDLDRFFEPVFTNFITAATSAPPEHNPSDACSRPDSCEICGRAQLPLTYHHLIPRAVHDKAVKRGWHAEWEVNKVAWLCRACHSFVHRVATNEELARELFSVELLMEREDVQKWAGWVSRIRWKAR